MTMDNNLLQFYMKSRLNKLLLVDNWEESNEADTEADVEIKTEPTTNGHADDQDADDGNDDEFWESLDTVEEEKKKATKRKLNGDERVPVIAMDRKSKTVKRKAKK